MAGLLDELKGLLPDAEYQKLVGNDALRTRIARGDELRSYYDGDDPAQPTPPAPQGGSNPPEPQRATPPSMDLSGIERMLDSKLSKINETIETKIADAVKTRGDELVNNAVKISIQRADELNRVYARHHAEFGEAFDSAAFNEFLEKPENKGRFRSVTEAYEAMVGPKLQEKTINSEVDRRVKERTSGPNVPGTTPGPAMSSNIRVIMSRGRTDANGQPNSRVDRAAAALDRRMSAAVDAAS